MNHQFFYNLLPEKIAAYPAQERSHSKLLVYTQNHMTDSLFSNICSFLPEHSLLIRNTSRVIKARLFLKRKSGGIIEVFCLNFNHQTSGSSTIECLIKNVRKLSEGEILSSEKIFNGILIKLTATYSGRKGENCLIEFRWEPENFVFLNILDIFGEAPLPPYIKRKAEENDALRYQTIYAQENGSVAAPTAGLHFTEDIETQLKSKKLKLQVSSYMLDWEHFSL
jgi:S-adenosylmethionine:tRNA ribosyltransferase-isomerase